jgi:SAM-dependent methyltransferase
MMMYRLEAGMSYSFRYDENDKLDLFEGSHGRSDAVDLAPYVTTPMMVVEKMLEMADISDKDVLYYIGCGDGRIVILAAKKYGARGVGIDIDPLRITEARENARSAGVQKLVEFRELDATKADISEATVVTLYLLPESNELLKPILKKQLKPGSRILSHNYHIPGWERREMGFLSLKTPDGEEHDIYLYKL